MLGGKGWVRRGEGRERRGDGTGLSSLCKGVVALSGTFKGYGWAGKGGGLGRF